MTDDDQQHEPGECVGVVHLHVLGQRDDLHRLRITLTAGMLAMYDDWPCTLAHDLFMDAVFQVTTMCGIEVAAHDQW